MWKWSVAFDGWATALVAGVLFTVLFTVAITIVLRRVERQRAVAVALAVVPMDLADRVHRWEEPPGECGSC
jgi:hypothetical protein